MCTYLRWAGLWLRELSGLTVILSSAFSLLCTLALGIGLQGGVLPGLNWLFSYVILLQLTCIPCGLVMNVPYGLSCHAYTCKLQSFLTPNGGAKWWGCGRCDLNKYDFRIFLTAFLTSVLGVLTGWAFMDGGLRRLTKATTRFPLDYVRMPDSVSVFFSTESMYLTHTAGIKHSAPGCG